MKEISFILSGRQREAEDLAARIRAMDTWDPDLTRELCELAELKDEYDAADGETVESVIFKAAEKLKVEII